MKLKQIFCKHQWERIAIRHKFLGSGHIAETYHRMKCKKCGREFESKCVDHLKFKNAENMTSNILEMYNYGAAWD